MSEHAQAFMGICAGRGCPKPLIRESRRRHGRFCCIACWRGTAVYVTYSKCNLCGGSCQKGSARCAICASADFEKPTLIGGEWPNECASLMNPEKVAQIRRIFCARYDVCQRYAMDRNWQGWECSRCEVREDVAPYIPLRRAIGE